MEKSARLAESRRGLPMRNQQDSIACFKPRANRTVGDAVPTVTGDLGQDSLGNVQGSASVGAGDASWLAVLNGRHEFALLFQQRVALRNWQFRKRQIVVK